MVVDDSFYMQLSLNEAWKYQALTYPNPPVGSLILDAFDKIVTIDAHKEAGSAHAELLCCIEAAKSLGDDKIGKLSSPILQHEYLMKHYKDRFKDYKIFVTLEPCMHEGKTPSCALLIKHLGFSKIYIGTNDPNSEASGAIDFLKSANTKLFFGILKKKCDKLIYPFTKWQKNENFVFFKLAKHQNGVISGKRVSSNKSRSLVHKMRAKIDLLVIGGDTVRCDKPILDARLANSNNPPDILIYTSKDDIDRNIALFKIKNRKVFIEDSLKKINDYSFVMIEGGEGMFFHTKDIVDYYLIFTTSKFKPGKKINLDANLKSLHCFKNCSDTIEWFENIDKGKSKCTS